MIGLCLEKEKILTNELYLTLIKFLRKNPDEKCVISTWQVMASVCSTIEPSEEFLPYVYNYLYQLINNHPLDQQKEWARVCLKRLY